MLSNTKPHLDSELLSAIQGFTKNRNEPFGKEISVILTWKAWKTLELWSAGLAIAFRDKGTLYDFKVTTGASESICAGSFETLGNKIFNHTSILSSNSICIDLDWHDFTILTHATDRSLRLFSQVGAHVGISLSLCFPVLAYLHDLILIQATPVIFELGGFQTSAVTATSLGHDLVIVCGEESKCLSEIISNIRQTCDVGF